MFNSLNGSATTFNSGNGYYTTIGGNAMDSFRMPACIAETQEDFLRHYTNLPKNWWENNTGFAEALIQGYRIAQMEQQLSKLKVQLKRAKDKDLTLYKKLWEESGSLEIDIRDCKIMLANLIAYVCEESMDRAYKIMSRMYIPEDDEYEMLIKKEYSTKEDDEAKPYEKGVFDSVSAEDSPKFKYSLHRWDEYHDGILKEVRVDYEHIIQEDNNKLDELSEKINLYKSELEMLEDGEGSDMISSTAIDLKEMIEKLESEYDELMLLSAERQRAIERSVAADAAAKTKKNAKAFARQIDAEWLAMTPTEQAAWGV